MKKIRAKKYFLGIFCLLVIIFLILECTVTDKENGEEKKLSEIIGSTHNGSKYNFTTDNFLSEGSDRILGMGMKVIKVWFHDRPDDSYPFNSSWPTITSFEQLAETSYYKQLFNKPFKTYILVAYSPGRWDHYYRDEMTSELVAEEKQKFYEITKYFLLKYGGTGKTFILQNWEGDGSLELGWDWNDRVPNVTELQGMVAWLNARQDGVEQARQEYGMVGVKVYNAAEVNLVLRAKDGTGDQIITCTNNVIPYTRCDLYSYSSYDSSTTGDPVIFLGALNYLKAKAPNSHFFGADNIYIGEFGLPENEYDAQAQFDVCKGNIETALDFGVRYMIYWQLYCNEVNGTYTSGRPINSEMRGFWLMRPDGTKSLLWDYLKGLLD